MGSPHPGPNVPLPGLCDLQVPSGPSLQTALPPVFRCTTNALYCMKALFPSGLPENVHGTRRLRQDMNQHGSPCHIPGKEGSRAWAPKPSTKWYMSDLRINLAKDRAIEIIFKLLLWMVHVCTEETEELCFRRELAWEVEALHKCVCVYMCVWVNIYIYIYI